MPHIITFFCKTFCLGGLGQIHQVLLSQKISGTISRTIFGTILGPISRTFFGKILGQFRGQFYLGDKAFQQICHF